MRETTLLLLPEVRGLPEDPGRSRHVDPCFLLVASRLIPGRERPTHAAETARLRPVPRIGQPIRQCPCSETLSLVHKPRLPFLEKWQHTHRRAAGKGLLAVHLAGEGCLHDRDMRLRGGPGPGLR